VQSADPEANVVIRPRLFLADDHDEILQAEAEMLQPHFDIIGVAHDGVSLVADVERLHPDVVVLDIMMPRMNGIEALRRLINQGCEAKFVFLTIHSEEEFVNVCMSEGARGYVWKARMKAHLIPAVYSALKGEAYVSPLTSA